MQVVRGVAAEPDAPEGECRPGASRRPMTRTGRARPCEPDEPYSRETAARPAFPPAGDAVRVAEASLRGARGSTRTAPQAVGRGDAGCGAEGPQRG